MPFKRYANKSSYETFQDQWKESNVLKKYYSTFYYPEIFKRIKKYSNKNSLILEAGCGLGGWVVRLHNYGFNITGIDIIPQAIEAIKKYNKKLNVYLCDVRHIDLPDNSVDLYLSLGVIEHDENGPESILEEAFRIIKKNGYGIISVPNHNSVDLYKRPNLKEATTFYQYEYSKKEYIDTLKMNKFEVIEIFTYGSFIFLSRYKILRKKANDTYALNIIGKAIIFIISLFKLQYYSRMICAIVSPIK